jgi:CRP-like cAMP-binding protein
MVESGRRSSLNSNWILATLPKHEYGHLLQYMEPVRLSQGETIYVSEDHIDHVYFPTSGIVSLVSLTAEGEAVEVAMVGSEGMVGIPVVLGFDTIPWRAEVQIAGDGIKMSAEVLRNEFNRGGSLQVLLHRYMYLLIIQLSQSAVCNRFHKVGERLCRWLLVAGDRAQSDEFNLTQEHISLMMGSHRPSVSVAARSLQEAGLIRYNRGQIAIVDRQGLEACSCECYTIVKDKFRQLVKI